MRAIDSLASFGKKLPKIDIPNTSRAIILIMATTLSASCMSMKSTGCAEFLALDEFSSGNENIPSGGGGGATGGSGGNGLEGAGGSTSGGGGTGGINTGGGGEGGVNCDGGGGAGGSIGEVQATINQANDDYGTYRAFQADDCNVFDSTNDCRNTPFQYGMGESPRTTFVLEDDCHLSGLSQFDSINWSVAEVIGSNITLDSVCIDDDAIKAEADYLETIGNFVFVGQESGGYVIKVPLPFCNSVNSGESANGHLVIWKGTR